MAQLTELVYRTSFKEEFIDYDEELHEEVLAYFSHEVDFKVLNENKVLIDVCPYIIHQSPTIIEWIIQFFIRFSDIFSEGNLQWHPAHCKHLQVLH